MKDFKLSEAFIETYKTKEVDWGPIGEVVYMRTYSRKKEDGSNEMWWETLKRVVEGIYNIQKKHCDMFKLPWKDSKAQKSAQIMYDKMFNFKFLPPGRGLWAMGTKFIEEKGGSAVNNCLSGDTKIFTKEHGLVELADVVGNRISAWTNSGWVESDAKSFGVQELNEISFKPAIADNSRTNFRIKIRATSNHGWMLKNGEKTYSLKIGDTVNAVGLSMPANDERGLVWGYIYADGTVNHVTEDGTYRHSIRLCGEKANKKYLFEDVTYPETYNGDPVGRFNAKKSFKELPKVKDLNFIASFLKAWLEFDGYEKGDGYCLDTTREEDIEFIKNYAPLVNLVVSGVSIENKDTNFGKRNKPLIRIKLQKIEKAFFQVVDIAESVSEEEVFCLEVPNKNEFTLAGGLNSLNCGFISTIDIDVRGSFAFTWNMDALMLGVGVGFDTKGAGKLTIKQPKEDGVFEIPDSREGWVESLGLLLDSYFLGKGKPRFSYDQIRPYGAPIKGFGGVASGPEPLKIMHEKIDALLSKRIGGKISSTDIVDIMNMIGVCVVAGNVRRSAEIAIGNWDDKEYTTMKDYTLYPDEMSSHRWASNNSIFAEVGKTDYNKIAKSIALNGEPGVVWLENLRKFSRTKDAPDYKDKLAVGVNPCSEQTLESGELCCLVETFPSRHVSYEEYRETLKYAYLYGKTVTLLPTHWPETNAILLKNRRIGLSQTGIVDAFVRHGRRNILNWSDSGYEYLKELDEIYSNWLCIPKSIKMTSIKPSGSVSLLPGVSAGIHYPHDEYYIRRVRIASNSPLVAPLVDAGYEYEFSAYGASEEEKLKTLVFSFPVKEPFFDRKKSDVSIWEQVKNCVDYQRFWADNNVSITVTFKKEEEAEIPKVLEAYEDVLKAISFLPLKNHGYVQAPYESITKDKYESMAMKIKKPDFSKMTIATEVEKFCTNDGCAV